MLVFWVVTRYGLLGNADISEEHTVSSLRAENGGSVFL
jgi:hypothetical protein